MSEQRPQPPGKRGRRWKRTAAAALLLLAGGAIVNVAVAWVIAWWVFDLEETAEARVATAFDSEGWVIESWWADRHEGFGSTAFSTTWLRSKTNRPHLEGYSHPSQLLPRWLGFSKPIQAFVDEVTDRDDRSAVLRGWPLRALGCIIYIDEDTDPPLRPAMAINAGYGPNSIAPRLLPLRPVLPGFIINTLFYALLLWLLFFAPFAARRMLRRRRGLCETCAYPIGVSTVCTECGATVARRNDP